MHADPHIQSLHQPVRELQLAALHWQATQLHYPTSAVSSHSWPSPPRMESPHVCFLEAEWARGTSMSVGQETRVTGKHLEILSSRSMRAPDPLSYFLSARWNEDTGARAFSRAFSDLKTNFSHVKASCSYFIPLLQPNQFHPMHHSARRKH